MRPIIFAIVTVFMILGPNIVHAQNGRVTGDATGQMIQSWLQARGLPAKLSATRRGDPRIVFRLDGVRVVLVFFACRGSEVRACKGIQFSTGYRMRGPQQLELLNRWNRSKRYARAFRLRTRLNAVRLEQDLSFSGGMTRRIFYAHLILYRRLNRAFRAHIGFRLKRTIPGKPVTPGKPPTPGRPRDNQIRDL